MTDHENGELRVVVPVGFLLDEEREVTVSVDRPDGDPLPIRLRLVPARTDARDSPAECATESPAVELHWPTRCQLATTRADDDDGYPGFDVGGGD